MTDIPVSIGRLAKLEGLSLYENEIKILPGSIGKLPKLRHLYIHNNNLSEIPSSLALLSPDLNIDCSGETLFEGNPLAEYE